MGGRLHQIGWSVVLGMSSCKKPLWEEAPCRHEVPQGQGRLDLRLVAVAHRSGHRMSKLGPQGGGRERGPRYVEDRCPGASRTEGPGSRQGTWQWLRKVNVHGALTEFAAQDVMN